MNKILVFLLLPVLACAQYAHESNHISPDFGEDDVVKMRIGPFLNNSRDVVAIHVSKYDEFLLLERELRAESDRIDSLGLLMYDYKLRLSDLKEDLDACIERGNRKKMLKFDYLNFIVGALIGGTVLLTVKK
jgi:hypothetical protein